jgi:hypothetical protein
VSQYDMGWGCVPGDIVEKLNDKGEMEFMIVDVMKAMQTLVNKIAERQSLIWNKVHREIHGICGGFTKGVMAFFARLIGIWFGKTNSGCVAAHTDGDNNLAPGQDRAYGSLTDRLVVPGVATYVRFNAEATEAVCSHIIKNCVPRTKDDNKVWLSVLPQVWGIGLGNKGHGENATAMINAYEKTRKKKAVNRGKVWVKPVIPDPVTPDVPDVPDVVVKPPFKWQGWWNNRINWIVKNRGIVAIAVLISLILFWNIC